MANQVSSPTPPPGEIVWVSHYNRKHDLQYIITSKLARDVYSLYELQDGVFVRWGRGRDPQSLADRYEKNLAGKLEQGVELEEELEP